MVLKKDSAAARKLSSGHGPVDGIKAGCWSCWLSLNVVVQSSRPDMWVSVSVLTAIPSESTTSVYFSPVFTICSWRLGRTSCAFILSASGVSLSLQAHLNPIGHSQYTSLIVVALLCLLRTLRIPLIPNSKINCCALAFLRLSLLCCFSSSHVCQEIPVFLDFRSQGFGPSEHSSDNPTSSIRHEAKTHVFECLSFSLSFFGLENPSQSLD